MNMLLIIRSLDRRLEVTLLTKQEVLGPRERSWRIGSLPLYRIVSNIALKARHFFLLSLTALTRSKVLWVVVVSAEYPLSPRNRGSLVLGRFIDRKYRVGKGLDGPTHIDWDRYKGNIEDVITHHSVGIKTEGAAMRSVRPFSMKWRCTLLASYFVNARSEQKKSKGKENKHRLWNSVNRNHILMHQSRPRSIAARNSELR